MNPLFIADVRTATLREVHETFERQHLQAEADVLRRDGGTIVLKHAIDRVRGLHNVLDSVREKELGDMEAEDQLKAAAFAKHWLEQSIALLEKLYAGEEQAKVRAVGKVVGLKQCVDSIEGMCRALLERRSALEKAIVDGDIHVEDGTGDLVSAGERPRPTGVRPGGKTIRQQRQEEGATAEEAAAAAKAEEDDGAAAGQPDKQPTKKNAPVKRRTAKKKATKKK